VTPSPTQTEIQCLIDVLPDALRERVRQLDRLDDLVEIITDLGRPPEVRWFDGATLFTDMEVTEADLEHAVSHIGDFGEDNRAGIARTLHRISCIRNRKGRVIGLTLRVGRAVFGTVEMVRDIVSSGQSVLLLGRPGVGKTTMLRETARILAEEKRVVIVDTSNEIAGDGDIPHPAIGRARRMQVTSPSQQHEVMIEAVENHNPEVVVIDEIGRELEAQAARTIAERGVQLIGTAHGNTLDNLLMNPTLSDLIGGIESVTLSDEEARRRGTQKSVLERRAPPTFSVLIEILGFRRLAVHHDVAQAVDGLLRGRPIPPEIRHLGDGGERVIEPALPLDLPVGGGTLASPESRPERFPVRESSGMPRPERFPVREPGAPAAAGGVRTVRLYPYGVSQGRLRQSGRSLAVPLVLTDGLSGADALITLKSYFRKRPPAITEAEAHGVPIYVLRSNTTTQIEHALVDIFGLADRTDPFESALDDARQAVQQILVGARPMVELAPQSAGVRRAQHEVAREANLLSLSHGKDPHRRVRIYRNDQAR
jgi:stage III sporulation protein SpoIIIAA